MRLVLLEPTPTSSLQYQVQIYCHCLKKFFKKLLLLLYHVLWILSLKWDEKKERRKKCFCTKPEILWPENIHFYKEYHISCSFSVSSISPLWCIVFKSSYSEAKITIKDLSFWTRLWILHKAFFKNELILSFWNKTVWMRSCKTEVNEKADYN